jgi:glycosyl hydrolase family 12
MTVVCRVVVVVVILLSAAVSGGMARAQDAGAADIACGLHERITQHASGGVWVYSRPNAFNTSGQRLCISGSTSRPGFTILNNLRYTGAWQAYPFTGAGCAFNLCSRYTKLPMKVRELPAAANTSFSWTGSAPGNWNTSYDLWLDHYDQITRQDDGAELMIWLRPNPGYRGGTIVHIANRRYWFMHWVTCHNAPQVGVTPPRVSPAEQAGICWNYVQFRFLRVVHSVRRLWIMPFIRFLERKRLVRPSWWLTSVHAGYELVSGGKGLTTTGFKVGHLGGYGG